jgi:prepilin-type processing-associated H-X9-DG protein
MQGTLFAYTRAAGIYRCPTDRSTVKGTPGQLRFRSYQLNAALNGGAVLLIHPHNKVKATELREPAKVFTFLDSSHLTISDGVFFVQPFGDVWWDNPSDRHSQGANLAFAAGHVESWRWRFRKRNSAWYLPAATSRDLQDLRRLQNALPGR